MHHPVPVYSRYQEFPCAPRLEFEGLFGRVASSRTGRRSRIAASASIGLAPDIDCDHDALRTEGCGALIDQPGFLVDSGVDDDLFDSLAKTWSSRCSCPCRPTARPTPCATQSDRRSSSSPNTCAGRSHGTKARRWPRMSASRSRPTPTCTSATRTHPGSAARTRTRTGCSGNNYPTAPTSLPSPRASSIRLLLSRTNVHEKHSAGTHPPRSSTSP